MSKMMNDKWIGDYYGWSIYKSQINGYFATGPDFNDAVEGFTIAEVKRKIREDIRNDGKKLRKRRARPAPFGL